VNAIVEELPRIKKLIEDGKIDTKDLGFLKYNGCEIIP
jgi:hypothetical protein